MNLQFMFFCNKRLATQFASSAKRDIAAPKERMIAMESVRKSIVALGIVAVVLLLRSEP